MMKSKKRGLWPAEDSWKGVPHGAGIIHPSNREKDSPESRSPTSIRLPARILEQHRIRRRKVQAGSQHRSTPNGVDWDREATDLDAGRIQRKLDRFPRRFYQGLDRIRERHKRSSRCLRHCFPCRGEAAHTRPAYILWRSSADCPLPIGNFLFQRDPAAHRTCGDECQPVSIHAPISWAEREAVCPLSSTHSWLFRCVRFVIAVSYST
jgi:hypothetical protein